MSGRRGAAPRLAPIPEDSPEARSHVLRAPRASHPQTSQREAANPQGCYIHALVKTSKDRPQSSSTPSGNFSVVAPSDASTEGAVEAVKEGWRLPSARRCTVKNGLKDALGSLMTTIHDHFHAKDDISVARKVAADVVFPLTWNVHRGITFPPDADLDALLGSQDTLLSLWEKQGPHADPVHLGELQWHLVAPSCFVKAFVRITSPAPGRDLYVVGMDGFTGDDAKKYPKQQRWYNEHLKRSCTLADTTQLKTSMARVLSVVGAETSNDVINLRRKGADHHFLTWNENSPALVHAVDEEGATDQNLINSMKATIELFTSRGVPFGEMEWRLGSDQVNLAKLAALGASGLAIAGTLGTVGRAGSRRAEKPGARPPKR